MKKILITLTCLLMLSSIALASPQMDFSQGKGSIDINWRNTENSITNSDYAQDFSKKYNFDGTITYGLGNNFALQYRNFVPESKTTSIYGYDVTAKLRTNEYNLLYKLDKNVAVLAGVVNAKGELNFENYGGTASTDTKNYWQVGVVASTNIATNTTLWGSVAAGKNLTNYEIGIGYQFAPSWEFNVNYRDLKLKNFTADDVTPDIQAKGLGLGVTYKF
ncbi:MAG: hypothetical protein H6Q74_1803 [Firmicutes bacterium]|nr:hypothetical protein [Bacillota bacterium]